MKKEKKFFSYIRELFGVSALFCLLLLSVSFVSLPLVQKENDVPFVAAASEKEKKPMVILDPGHGGVDSGAVSVSGAEEKNLNLAVAKKIGAFLESAGVEVIYTRETDDMLTSNRGNTRKIKDLLGRVEIAEKYPNAVFVSIHMNTLSIEKYCGIQVFYSDQNSANHPLAQEIQNTAVSLLQPENERKAKNANGKIYILDRIEQPAVLIECGFLSNKNEDLLLQSEEYQSLLAFSISRPILDLIL